MRPTAECIETIIVISTTDDIQLELDRRHLCERAAVWSTCEICKRAGKMPALPALS